MRIVVLNRGVHSVIRDGELYENTFLGSPDDTTNFTVSSTAYWDEDKTDYQIGDLVKLPNFDKEWACIKADTRAFPLADATSWINGGGIENTGNQATTLAEYRYRDNSSRFSYTDVDVPVEMVLNTTPQTNFLFLSNLQNISHILVKAVGDSEERILLDTSMRELVAYRKHLCCSVKFDFKDYMTVNLNLCGIYNKIQITLTPILGSIPKVGNVGLGVAHNIGCLNSYPSFKISSLSKMELDSLSLDLVERPNYLEATMSVDSPRGQENQVDKLIMNNIGRFVFVDLDEFPEKNNTKLLGFFKSAPSTIKSSKYQEIKFKFYGIPTVQKG